jgi:TonB-dependent receptor
MPTLNGERFLTAEGLLETRTAFQDVPASLVSGVNVYKSQNASILDGGIGGVVDVRTIRSLELDPGFSGGASAQLRYGNITSDADTQLEGTLGYNWGKTAMSLSASYSDSTNAAFFQDIGNDHDFVDEFSTWICPEGCGDLNGDGDSNDQFITPLGWNTAVSNREFDRERVGLAYNFNAQISDSWEVVADVIYNEMKENQDGQQLFVNGNFLSRSFFSDPGSNIGNSIDSSNLLSNDRNFVNNATLGRSGLRAGVNSDIRNTEALNTNIEFRYDNGGAFRGTLRAVFGDASREGAAVRLHQQTNSQCISASPQDAVAGVCNEINPGAIVGQFTNTIDNSNRDSLFWSIDPQLSTLAANPESWYLHSSWYEANLTDADQAILRADGSYDLNEKTSIDFGVRYGDRGTTERRSDYFSPSGIGDSFVKFAEVGYPIGQSGAEGGTAFGLNYDPLPFYQLEGPELSPFLVNVSDFNVSGLDVVIPMLDSGALAQNFASFRDTLYGPGKFIDAPDRSYAVDEEQLSAYVQVNFDTELNDSWVLTGNAGLRLVETTFEVTQNVVNGGRLRQDVLAGVDPNHTAYEDLGDLLTNTKRTETLPSLNLNFDYNDTHRIKAAYMETLSQPSYFNLGRGEITFFNGEQVGENFQRVSSVQRLGNPNLDPTTASQLAVAWEWYPTDNSIVTVGAFKVDFDTSVYQSSSQIAVADSDGVVRNGATLLELRNGSGGSYEGLEFGFQTSFDKLPGFWSNTGITVNYTYSPSSGARDAETGEQRFLAGGAEVPFNSSAEHQGNLILFYQDEKLQLRLAANYKSDQFSGGQSHWTYGDGFAPDGASGRAQFQDEQFYVAFSASYDVNDSLQVFLNGSNITEESPSDFRGSESFRTNYNQFESIWSVGVRSKF